MTPDERNIECLLAENKINKDRIKKAELENENFRRALERIANYDQPAPLIAREALADADKKGH